MNQINGEQDDNKKAHLMRRLSFQMFQMSRKLLVTRKNINWAIKYFCHWTFH